MLSQARLDERFLDRGGCGDELYADARQRASIWLAGLNGTSSLGDLGLDGDDCNDDVDGDDSASH